VPQLASIVVPSFTLLLQRYRDVGAGVAAEPSREPVHDLRVVVRRLRAAVRLLRPVSEAPRIRTGPLRRLERLLGDVRDEDVAMGWFDAESLGELGLAPDEHLARVVRAAARRRNRAAERLTEALEGKKLLRTLHALEAWVSAPRLSATAEAPANAIVPDLVAPDLARVALHRAWHRSWPPAFDAVTSGELHQLRRRLKRLRYGVEFLEPAWGGAAGQWLPEWHAVLDGLGTWHDLDLAAPRVSRGRGHPAAIEALARRAALALVDWPRWRASWTDPARLARLRAQMMMG
jgi:CHAD domain-containing protein